MNARIISVIAIVATFSWVGYQSVNMAHHAAEKHRQVMAAAEQELKRYER